MKLYVIGNGFDLAHDLKTKYQDFLDVAKQQKERGDEDAELLLEFYPDTFAFWSDAEKHICEISKLAYQEDKKASQIFGLDLSRLKDLLGGIKRLFDRFIIKADQGIDSQNVQFKLNADALFLTFNYTTTLEQLYKIEERRVLHIHGSVEGSVSRTFYNIDGEPCVLGHSQTKGDFVLCDGEINHDPAYLRFIEATQKNADQIMEEKGLAHWLEGNHITEIIFYGFGCSEADFPYVKYLLRRYDPRMVKYTFYYHAEKGEPESEAVARMKKCAGPNAPILFVNDKRISGNEF